MTQTENKLQVKKLDPNAILPKRQTSESAGYDICSIEDYMIPPHGRQLIDTGLSITVPKGTYGQIAPRSGMSCKGTHVGAGVIDRDYTGHVKVLLFNLNSDEFITISKGDRVAQLLLKHISLSDVLEVEELEITERGDGGFGSTGV
jgi:dUTP pyrophosphatase